MCQVLGGGPAGGCTFSILNVRSCRNFQHQKTNYLSIILLFAADEIKELWEEYENNSSIEANLVKDFDKVRRQLFL